MTKGWHEGTIGTPGDGKKRKIAHYFVRTAERKQKNGLGRITHLEIEIDDWPVAHFEKGQGWIIKPDENDRDTMIAYTILTKEYC